MLRTVPYEAAQGLLTQRRNWSRLKVWGKKLAQRRGVRRAIVAVARRLAVILHRMWTDGTDFRGSHRPQTPFAGSVPSQPYVSLMVNRFGSGVVDPGRWRLCFALISHRYRGVVLHTSRSRNGRSSPADLCSCSRIL